MPDLMTDRRVAKRYPLVMVAEIIDAVSRSKIYARSSDVSRTGCYIDSLSPFTSGTKVIVHLIRGKDIFESSGTVRYVNPGLGMGVQFDDQIPPNQLALLDRWLEECVKRNHY